MEQIEEKLKNLQIAEVPNHLHSRVMRRVFYKKFEPVFMLAFLLLAFNLLAILSHINGKLIDAEFLDMAQDFLDVFDVGFSYFAVMSSNFFEIISPLLVVSSVLSLVGMIVTAMNIDSFRFKNRIIFN